MMATGRKVLKQVSQGNIGSILGTMVASNSWPIRLAYQHLSYITDLIRMVYILMYITVKFEQISEGPNAFYKFNLIPRSKFWAVFSDFYFQLRFQALVQFLDR